MTSSETARILQAITTYWPGSKVRADELTVRLWQAALADLPVEVAELAVMRLAATLKFPPSVAEIREAVATAVSEARGAEPAAEAVRKIGRAIRNFGYYRPAEARAFIGEAGWRAVQSVGGWQALCEGDFAVLSAQLERRYAAGAAWEREKLLVPGDIRERLSLLVSPMLEKMALPEGDDSPADGEDGGEAEATSS